MRSAINKVQKQILRCAQDDNPGQQRLAKKFVGLEAAEDLFDGPVERVGAFDGDGGVGLGGEDVLFGHGAGGGFELVADGLLGAAAFAHVAVDAAVEANLIGGVDVDAEVVEREKLGVVEGEDAFDEDDAGGGDGVEGVGNAGVAGEIVDGTLDGEALRERSDVVDEELGFEGIGMVEVLLVAGVEGELREVAVVEIEGKEGGIELDGELPGERGLP